MDAVAESGRNPASKHQVQKIIGLTRDGTAEPARDQSLRRERAQENIHFSYSADHEQG